MGDAHVYDGTVQKLIHFQSVASERRVNIAIARYVKLGNGMPVFVI
jgi:hypothetical protein